MSEFKGTPGPWSVRNHEIQSVGSDGEMTAICYGIANANLIAAAPELLEALKYARRFLNKADHDIDYIDAVVAKALGQ